ncbi:MAG: DUF5683 domain-containing protein [candidate division KSB1 bacterium]|nr:DUF5683 domain-containing protein [candidate division KSB1 bacterium]
MRKTWAAVAGAIFILLAIQALAESPGIKVWYDHPWMQNTRQGELHLRLNSPLSLSTLNPGRDWQQPDSVVQKRPLKFPGRALLFSAVIPGTGQIYTKSYLTAAAFLGVEIFAWTYFATNQSKGKDIEKEYRAYADAHWDPDRYWAWLAYFGKTEEDPKFTHKLDPVGTQQYYEMIGKYNQFNAGWDDYNWSDDASYEEAIADSNRTPNRLYYMDRRRESNQFLKRATTGVSIVLLNHILSAIEGSWSAYRYNKKHIRTSLRIETLHYSSETCPALRLTIKW